MQEYAIFNDEGAVETDFYSLESAIDGLKKYPPNSELFVNKLCPECRDWIQGYCECELDG